MGEVHISKDREVHMHDVENMARLHDNHMSMIIKILRVGQSHGHKGRFRESYLGGQNPSVMYLLIKDHKPKDSKGLYKTRPVVAANTSYNVGLSETISVILESLYNDLDERAGAISTDDMLARINLVSEEVKKAGGTFAKKGAPEEKAYGKGRCFVHATDVEALFPSLESKTSARICREEIKRSKLDVQIFEI